MNLPPAKYPLSTVALHWMLVALVFALYGLGWHMVGIPKGTPPVSYFYNLHKSIGLLAGIPIVWLICWRLTHVAPPLPGTIPAWQVKATKANHLMFYVCLVVMTLSGFIESNFTKYGIKFFGYQLPLLGWEDKAIYYLFNRIHVYTSYLFAALIALHVAAALRHLLLEKDGVFQRMLP
ncbi:MAG TPA: cytochrome b [Burkholderiales bacterium]|nr:cytochrome b [Burkholderiales bacterium]